MVFQIVDDEFFYMSFPIAFQIFISEADPLDSQIILRAASNGFSH